MKKVGSVIQGIIQACHIAIILLILISQFLHEIYQASIKCLCILLNSDVSCIVVI